MQRKFEFDHMIKYVGEKWVKGYDQGSILQRIFCIIFGVTIKKLTRFSMPKYFLNLENGLTF